MEEEKLAYVLALLSRCAGLRSGRYDAQFVPQAQDMEAQETETEDAAFMAQRERVQRLIQEGRLPAVLPSGAGLAWAVVAVGEGLLVLGPARIAEGGDAQSAHLPVLSVPELSRYASMLHMAAHGDAAPVYVPGALPDASALLLLARLQERVRNGDMHYKELTTEVLTNWRSLLALGAVTTDSAKSVARFTVERCCQAAMESGLGKNAVDALCEEYLPQLEAASAAHEIAQVCDSILYHLVRLVHRAKGSATFSEPVQSCCTYVEEHICDKLTLSFLAKRTGYSPDHLSKKFQQEYGETIKDYILRSKVQRAQLLLTTTDLSICTIADMFAFCSSSHFTQVFRRYTRYTPANYRARYTHMA